jgi:hypothetical protein
MASLKIKYAAIIISSLIAGADIGYCLAVCKLITKNSTNRTKGTGAKGTFLV